MARESPLARAEQAAGQVLIFKRLLSTVEIAEAVDQVEATDLARIGAGLLSPNHSAVSILGPKAAMKAERAFQDALSAG